ncbi:hypothetical protein FBEOM_4610 [Fusarium beomiforme]|uniref:2EXR domain-containing protein n=1 Tax=Fusarium beomiforme TaxID=44412 RepID=A0A9P5AMX8_9HYPO|nr:hypothetical protein FBEOM_4610 [Fusarium beomiforme]
MFTLFQNLPPELRIQIWHYGLSEPRGTGICIWKKGCWIPKYLTPGDSDYCPDVADNIRFEFRHDLLSTPVKIPLVDVNLEARRVALAWARDNNNIKVHYSKGKYHFEVKMDNELDALYVPEDQIHDLVVEPVDRMFEPDLEQRNLSCMSYVTSFAVSEKLFDDNSNETLDMWDWYDRVERLYVVVGKQPDENLQWEIDTSRGTSLYWTKESGEFVLGEGEDICDKGLCKRIIDDKMKLQHVLKNAHTHSENFRLEIRVCSVVGR